MTELLDIKAKDKGIGGALSNFAPHAFTIDGVQCASMEGFLQSLKTPSVKKQQKICAMTGIDAKNVFRYSPRRYLFLKTHRVYWKGKTIDRMSEEFDRLITQAYDCLFENPDFRRALEGAKGKNLIHSHGKAKKKETVLTEEEFIFQLLRLMEKV